MKKYHIGHRQDLYDAKTDLDGVPFPYVLMAVSHRPHKGTDEYEKWLNSNSFFHRCIVPTFSELSGFGENEAKEELQKMFALVRDLDGEYEVESIAGMSLQRLVQFNENCQNFLIANYGEQADELLLLNVGKTKKIKK
jgi:hypothetical protein